MIDNHPKLVCASPQAPINVRRHDIAAIRVAFFSRCQRSRCRQDFFVGDDFHHNGAFYLPHAFRFLTNFGKDNPDPTRPVSPFGTFDYKTQDGYDWYLLRAISMSTYPHSF